MNLSDLALRLLFRLPERLVPRDTLYVGGQPYMHRFYLAGYAPTPGDPDAHMTCARCPVMIQRDAETNEWYHRGEADHDVQPVSAPRYGWRWQDHGLGAVRLHCTVASDDSRAFHDHPWPFLSIGLAGAYVETQPATTITKGMGAERQVAWASEVDHPDNPRRLFRAPFLNRKAATDLHVLEVDKGPVWSLFFTRPKVRSWGFAGPFGWLGWRAFDAEHPERDAWTA